MYGGRYYSSDELCAPKEKLGDRTVSSVLLLLIVRILFSRDEFRQFFAININMDSLVVT